MTIAKRWRCTTGGFAPLALTPCGTALGRGHLSERSANAVIRGLAQKQLKWFAILWTLDNITKQIIKSGPQPSTYTEALYSGFSCFPCLQEITATWRTLCSRRGSSISFCSLNKIHRHNSGPAKTPSLPPMLSLYQDLATSPVLQKPSLWKRRLIIKLKTEEFSLCVKQRRRLQVCLSKKDHQNPLTAILGETNRI